MKKMKCMSIIWGMLIVGIFIVLTLFGFLYKNKTKEINGVGAVKVTPIWNRTRNSKTYNIK